MKLEDVIGRGTILPDVFMDIVRKNPLHAVYVASCETSKLIYVDDLFESLTGYSKDCMKLGLEFWLSLIHPEDKPQVMEDIIQGHKKLNDCEDNTLIPELFLSLEYRFKKGDGKWIWIQELKFVTLTDGRIDKVLGLLIDIDEQRQLEEAQTRSNRYSPKLLDIAIQFKNVNKKMWIKKPTDESLPTSQPPGIALLTKREKEVLQLVGEGFSTKQISDKLNISINTVETHRRHLLEKLQVKNSMELIKEASKVFWF